MKTAVLLALLACCQPSLAQSTSEVPLPANVRMYQPKNLTPEQAERVAIFVHNFLTFPGMMVSWDNVPHAFVIRGGKPEEQAMAEALLHRYDVPEPRVDLTVYLIRASNSASPPTGNPLPPELKPAIDEMKGTFSYQHYSLWDAIVLHVKGRGGQTQGILPVEGNSRPYAFTVAYGLSGGLAAESKTVNLANFMFSIKMPPPYGKDDLESHIQTELTIREGEKLVLGRIRLLPGANADLFLVLSSKVY
jgi:hypothetical protein